MLSNAPFLAIGDILPFSSFLMNGGKQKRSNKSRATRRKQTARKSRATRRKQTARKSRATRRKQTEGKCNCDENKIYKGNEPSPKGMGFCAHCTPLKVTMKGRDGNLWENKVYSKGKRWVKVRSDM